MGVGGTVSYVKGLFAATAKYPLGFSPKTGAAAVDGSVVVFGSGVSGNPEISSKNGARWFDFHMKSTSAGTDDVYGMNVNLESAGTGPSYTINAYAKTSGGAASELGAIYAHAQLKSGAAITGQFYPAFFEMIVDSGVATMPSGGVVQLVSWNNGNMNAVSGYIGLREYGNAKMHNLFNFIDLSATPGADTTLYSNYGLKIRIGSTLRYIPALSSAGLLPSGKAFNGVSVLSSQTTENTLGELDFTTDSTWLTGDNITYSSARGSSILKMVGTWTGASGGFEGIDLKIATSGALTADGDGVIGAKVVVTNTAALTDGNIYAAQFIAKHNHASNAMGNSAALIGSESIAYISGAAGAGTCIGLNAVMRNYGTPGGGSVHRGIQVVLDQAGGAKATEATGICVWNMAGTWDAVLRVTGAFTAFANLDDASTFVTAITGAASTIAYQIKIITPDGAPGYLNVYSTSGT